MITTSLGLGCGAPTDPLELVCAGSPPSCVQGTVGGRCSDALTGHATCREGQWRCDGPGEVLVDACAGFGPPPPDGG